MSSITFRALDLNTFIGLVGTLGLEVTGQPIESERADWSVG